MLKRAKRASHIDPPASSYAIMRRARPYRGENPAPGEDVDGELDPTAGIRERPRPISDMTAKSANTLPGLAVDADGTSAEGYHVEEPTRHHQILVEMDHVVFVSDRQMHAKGSANT